MGDVRFGSAVRRPAALLFLARRAFAEPVNRRFETAFERWLDPANLDESGRQRFKLPARSAAPNT